MNEDDTLPPDSRTPLQRLYDRALRELVDQQPQDVRDQVEAAFAAPPADPDAVEPWFLEHFHKAPVSHDTALFNQLRGIKAAVLDAVSLSAG